MLSVLTVFVCVHYWSILIVQCHVCEISLRHAVRSVDDRSVRCELCNIELFRPTFSAFGFPDVWLNTGSLALSCCFYQLFIAVHMQSRETYTLRPLLEKGREYAAHLHLKWYTPKHARKVTFSRCLICGVFSTETSQTHSGDTQDQYYIL